MTWPLDVFWASLEDAGTMLVEEAGGENKRQKMKGLKEKAKARLGGGGWWA